MTEGEFATQKELESAGQTVVPLDVLDSHLHSFFVAYTKQLKTVGYPIPLNPGGGYVLGGSGEIAGYNIYATDEAMVILHDGPDFSFPAILTVTIPANTSVSAWFLPGGIYYQRGICLEVTGNILGTVFTAKEISL